MKKRVGLLLILFFYVLFNNLFFVNALVSCTNNYTSNWPNVSGYWGFYDAGPSVAYFGVGCNSGLTTWCHNLGRTSNSGNPAASATALSTTTNCGMNINTPVNTGKPYCKDTAGNNLTGVFTYRNDCQSNGAQNLSVSCKSGVMVAFYVTKCTGSFCGNEVNNADKPTCTYGNDNAPFNGYLHSCDYNAGDDYSFDCYNGYLQAFCPGQPPGILVPNQYTCGFVPCTPVCTNKCGGASDGCGGTCTGSCSPAICYNQACCTPSCTGIACGASDGCGGICSGYCSLGQTCSNYQCVRDCFDNQTISKFYSNMGVTASLWNGTGASDLCFEDIFGRTYENNTHICRNSNDPLFYLASSSNSLISLYNDSTYNIPVCFGNLSSRIINNSNSNSLVFYYSFDSNASDLSGNDISAFMSTGGIKNSSGRYLGAFNLDGSSGLLDAISSKKFYLNTFTLSSWFNTLYAGTIISPYTLNSTYLACGPGIGIDTITHQFSGKVADLGVTGIILNSPNTYNDGKWHYGALTYNGSFAKLYVDGVVVNSSALNFNVTGFTNYTRIGIGSGCHWGYFNGTIDELKFWNRSLTDSEINSEYTGGCNLDERAILKINPNSNSILANLGYFNYTIGICSKEKITFTPGNASFQDLNGNKISSAGKDDTVKLVLNRTDVFSKNITYFIYKKDGNSALWGLVRWDKLLGQFSSIGFLNWKANETGEFYFNSSVEGYIDNYVSDSLTVGLENNAKPIVNITKPLEYSTFIIKSDGFTNAIPFEIRSIDADDFVDAYWNFGDGNITNLTNCNDGVSNCNISHKFNSSFSGAKIINATLKESTRTQTEYDLDKLFFYKEGLTLFVIIDSPYYKTREFPATPIVVSATSTYVSNCSFSSTNCNSGASSIGKTCMQINDSVNPADNIYCYRFAESFSPKFRFNWTIDGNTSAQYPTNASTFKIIFPKGGKHDVGLKIIFNMSM